MDIAHAKWAASSMPSVIKNEWHRRSNRDTRWVIREHVKTLRRARAFLADPRVAYILKKMGEHERDLNKLRGILGQLSALEMQNRARSR